MKIRIQEAMDICISCICQYTEELERQYSMPASIMDKVIDSVHLKIKQQKETELAFENAQKYSEQAKLEQEEEKEEEDGNTE